MTELQAEAPLALPASPADVSRRAVLVRVFPVTRSGFAALIVATALLAAMFYNVYSRQLTGTVTEHGWGRTVQGVGAALTMLDCGVGGFVIDKRFDSALRKGGFSTDPRVLRRVDETYPHNLQNAELLQRALKGAEQVRCGEPGWGPAPDGTGHYPQYLGFGGEDAGMATFTIVAFSTFGKKISALTYCYFAILLVSLGLFVLAHGESRGAMVIAAVVCGALFLTSCSALLNFHMPAPFGGFPGIDIKDPRFLGTMAALPVLHVIVTWLRPAHRLRPRDYAILAVQGVILALAIHIRFPVAWTMLALPLLWLALAAGAMRAGRGGMLWRWRSARSIYALATVLAVLGAGQLFIAYWQHPYYAAEGDLPRHTFWDGVLQSLEYNPDWAKKYRPSFGGAAGDDLSAAVARRGVAEAPPTEREAFARPDGSITTIAYTTFAERAFLDILARDPSFVLRTFFIDKPWIILRSEFVVYRSLILALQRWHLAVIAAALLALIGLVAADGEALRLMRKTAAAALFCAVFALLPNWLVTANELVMFDNFLWGLTFLGLIAVVTVPALARAARRLRPHAAAPR